MGRSVAIGIQNFNELIENNCFYVDKTHFIKEWWDSRDSVTLITRLRRFGKTLTMSMVEQFFSVEYAGRSDLFEGLEIWQEEDYRAIQGTYPVISLSFANVKEKTYERTKERICQLIAELYAKNNFLLKSDLLMDADKQYFEDIKIDMPEVVATALLQNAQKQIAEKQYEAGLIAKGIPAERIRKYGFAFEGKEILPG